MQATADPLRQIRRRQGQSPRESCPEARRARRGGDGQYQRPAGAARLPQVRRTRPAYWEHVTGFDTNIHVAILSRFPFTARRPHTDDSFLLKRTPLPRQPRLCRSGLQVNTNYSFTLMAAHLKSKRAVAQADEAELRLEEAKLLREKIDAAWRPIPRPTSSSSATSTTPKILPRPRPSSAAASTSWSIPAPPSATATTSQLQTRPGPAQRHLDPLLRQGRHLFADRLYPPQPRHGARMGHQETYVLTIPNWGVGSDHRPIVATFEAEDK